MYLLILDSFCTTIDPQCDLSYLHSIRDLSLYIFIVMGSAIHHSLPPKQLPLDLKESFSRLWLSDLQKAVSDQLPSHCPVLSRRGLEMFCLHSQSLQIILEWNQHTFRIHMQALCVRGFLLHISASPSLLTSPTKNWTQHIGNSHTCLTWAWSFFTPNERSTNHSFKERNRRLSGICQCCENTTVHQWVQKQQKGEFPFHCHICCSRLRSETSLRMNSVILLKIC